MYDYDELDTLDMPDECPICGTELSTSDIDIDIREDEVVSMLYCPKCNYKKKLSVEPLSEFEDDDEVTEDNEDFMQEDDDETEEAEDDEDEVDLFPNGRDYDAEDEDGPFGGRD